MRELAVEARDAGRRLDAFLAERGAVRSRTEAQRMIDAGLVRVDGRGRARRHRVEAGERVTVEEPPHPAGDDEAPPAPHAVVFEDDHLIVVDKPAGVVVHPARGHTTGTLADALADRARGGPPGRAGIVHRLDRDTSGLMVVAKSEDAYAALQDMLRRREVRREYLALVEGHPDARTGTIEAPVGRGRRDRTAISTRTDRPREARTHFEVVETLPRTSLLELRLDTGRTHQIRVHLQAIGHPVVGDPRYGGAASGRRIGLGRQFLHSARLAFRHPVTGDEVAFEAELPPDLAAALERAQGESA